VNVASFTASSVGSGGLHGRRIEDGGGGGSVGAGERAKTNRGAGRARLGRSAYIGRWRRRWRGVHDTDAEEKGRRRRKPCPPWTPATAGAWAWMGFRAGRAQGLERMWVRDGSG
jgi:hypothetical protein